MVRAILANVIAQRFGFTADIIGSNFFI